MVCGGVEEVLHAWGADECLACSFEECRNVCHLQCCEEPLEAVPKGNWFCSKCSHEARGGGMDLIEDLVGHRGAPNRRELLVKWWGWPSSSNTWEPASHIKQTDAELLHSYMLEHEL
jgi:hypothetical protein